MSPCMQVRYVHDALPSDAHARADVAAAGRALLLALTQPLIAVQVGLAIMC